MKSPGDLLIRVEASAQIGNGHVMRCLALAQGWQDKGGTARFLCGNLPGSLSEILRAQGFTTMTMPFSIGGADDMNMVSEQAAASRWIVVDGDTFPHDYIPRRKSHYPHVMLIDDYGKHHDLPVDAILNQNLNASPDLYLPRAATQFLLGTEYLLLRREFRARKHRTTVSAVTRHLFVTLGGTDPDSISLRVASACARLDPSKFQVTLATTSANPNLPQLKEYCEMPSSVSLLVDTPDMAEIMSNSDLAVIASGGTLWELLYLGCPVLSYSRNQAQASILEDLVSLGAVTNMGAASAFQEPNLVSKIEELASSPLKRQSMSDAGASIVDGRGVDRVVEYLLQA